MIIDATAQGALEKLIRDINNKYVYWDKFKDMTLPVQLSHEEVWQTVTTQRNQGYTRELFFNDLLIRWWTSNALEKLLHQLDLTLAGEKNLPSLTDPKLIHRFHMNAVLEESIASAQLSGATISKRLVKEMLIKKLIPKNKEELVCLNIYKTLQIIENHRMKTMDKALFLFLHQLLTKDTIKPKGIGRYRSNEKIDTSNVEQKEQPFVVKASMVTDLMQHVFDFYNNDLLPYFIHPVIKAALLHYLIISIRPFKDGNGRIARILANMYLWKNNYRAIGFTAISSVILKLKQQYHKSILHSIQEKNAGYFINFFCQSLQIAYRSFADAVNKNPLKSKPQLTKKISGYNDRQFSILQSIKEDATKIVTIRELRTVYGISKETARTDLTILVEKGWLKYYHLNKKTYAFIKGNEFDAQISNLELI